MKPLLLIFLPSVGVLLGWFLRPVLHSAVGPSPSPWVSEQGASLEVAPSASKPTVVTAAALAAKTEVMPIIDPADPKAAIHSLMAFSRAGKSPMRMQARLIEYADQLKLADLKTLALEACNQPRSYWGSNGNALKEVLLARWTEMAPAEAIAFVKNGNTAQTREAMQHVFGQLASQDPAAAEAALAGLLEGPRKLAMRAIAMRLTSKDPAAALALLNRQKATPGDYSINMVMSIWSRQDASGAASYAVTMKDGQQRSQALYYAASGLAQSDPDAALAWAQSLAKAGERANMVRTVIAEVAERDPQVALALATAQPKREQRQLLQGVAGNWMQNDPDGAVTWVKTLGEGALKQDCLANMANYAMWSGTEKANEIIAMMPKGKQRRDTLENVTQYMGYYQDPETSLAWAKTLPVEDQDLVTAQLSGSLAQSDPKAAAKLAETLPPSEKSVQALSDVAGQWAETDPEAAMKWAGTLESDKARQDAMSRALTQWADRDPEKAAGATGQILDGNARRAARDQIAATWAAKAPVEAENWARGLPAEDRFSALASVWEATAADDPAKAGARLAALVPEAAGTDAAGAKLVSSATAVATAWVNQNPNSAAAWALNLPEGKAREAAVGAVADQWAGTDTMAASTWINGLPAGASRDEAAGKLINKILPTDPEAAFTWSANIADPDKQLANLKATINAWKVYNPAAVRATLGRANLEESVRVKLEAELK